MREARDALPMGHGDPDDHRRGHPGPITRRCQGVPGNGPARGVLPVVDGGARRCRHHESPDRGHGRRATEGADVRPPALGRHHPALGRPRARRPARGIGSDPLPVLAAQHRELDTACVVCARRRKAPRTRCAAIGFTFLFLRGDRPVSIRAVPSPDSSSPSPASRWCGRTGASHTSGRSSPVSSGRSSTHSRSAGRSFHHPTRRASSP